MSRRLRARYGATPLHLLGHIAAFAISAYALAQVLGGTGAVNFGAWFVGAVLAHDLVFLPLYSALDRIAGAGVRRAGARAPAVVNHLRVPALLSGLLALVYFPLILSENDSNFVRATGHHPEGYARNWALITAGLFLASALVYAARLRRRARPGGGVPPA